MTKAEEIANKVRVRKNDPQEIEIQILGAVNEAWDEALEWAANEIEQVLFLTTRESAKAAHVIREGKSQ